MFNMYSNRIDPVSYKTEPAATVINQLISPAGGYKTVITRLTVTTGATAHTLTVMRPLAVVTTTAAALASQKVVNISSDPGTIAENDLCVLTLADGTFQLNKVDSVSTLAITFDDDLEAAMASGAKVYFLGITTDGHEQAALPADTETTFESLVGYFVANNPGYPMVLSINNATNASVINGGCIMYVQG
jgi:hypothetical protein